MRKIALATILGLGLLTAAPNASRAQIAVGAQVGTIGLGGTVAFGLNSSVVFRGSVNIFPTDPEFELDGINYKTEFPTPQFLVTADFHPGGGVFYLAGGLHFLSDDFTVSAELTESVDIGNDTYTPQQVGTLVGSAKGNDVSPYLGIGLGTPVSQDRQIGFNLDLGVSFMGEPDISLDHEGGNLSQQEEEILQANLRQEEADAEDDALGIYPVLSFGLSFKVGGR